MIYQILKTQNLKLMTMIRIRKKNNNNKEINEIKNIQKNDKKFIVEEAELLNLEKEISLFESEENQYIIENTDTKDDNNKDLIDGLLNPPQKKKMILYIRK